VSGHEIRPDLDGSAKHCFLPADSTCLGLLPLSPWGGKDETVGLIGLSAAGRAS
jgi:hypothetical protein